MKTEKPNERAAATGVPSSSARLGSVTCGECGATATWHADHCDAGRAYYCGKCVAVPNRDGELSQLRRMPPGRDNIPADHSRRIAKIAHLPASMLRNEPPEVIRLCEEYRAGLTNKARELAGSMRLYSTDENGDDTPISVFHSA